MKPLRAKPVVLLCLALLAFCWGCARKKTVAAPPPPSPATEPTPQHERQETQAQTQTQLPTQGTPPPSPDQGTPAAENPEKAEAKNGKPHPPAKKPAAPSNGKTTEARNIPPRTVVRPDPEPSPTPGLISPSPSQGGPHDQATTEQLLQTTESNLTTIRRQLSQDEEATVTQIKDFVDQSRKAIKENDLGRAHNLAMKARLLCDDLIKHR
jgi:hypothetical protein